MDSAKNFVEQFNGLVEMPRGCSLEQWQYLYKHVVYSMGQAILEQFPQDVLGPDPFGGSKGGGAGGGSHPTGGGTTSPNKGRHPEKDGSGPGPGGGGHPYAIVVCILNGVLQLVPASSKKPDERSSG
jgi:hypothetical protein